MDDFKTEFSLFELTEQINEIEQKVKAKAIKINNQHLFHRLNSERMLEDILPLEVE